MKDKPNIEGIKNDGLGVAKELLDDPDLRRVIESLKGKMAKTVEDTGNKVGDADAVDAFREALEGAVSSGIQEALRKK